jgi:OST-HTH/LOTUS domain
MLALDPAFDERNYGSKSFRVLLSRLPDLIEVKKDRSSPDMRVTLVEPKKPPARSRSRKNQNS